MQLSDSITKGSVCWKPEEGIPFASTSSEQEEEGEGQEEEGEGGQQEEENQEEEEEKQPDMTEGGREDRD
jgi:hypothetical protein